MKRAGDSYLGIVSQCFCADKAGIGQPYRGRREQYLSNLAMKVNAKLNGKNVQLPDTPDLPAWTAKPYMVLGADVTHPLGESNQHIWMLKGSPLEPIQSENENDVKGDEFWTHSCMTEAGATLIGLQREPSCLAGEETHARKACAGKVWGDMRNMLFSTPGPTIIVHR